MFALHVNDVNYELQNRIEKMAEATHLYFQKIGDEIYWKPLKALVIQRSHFNLVKQSGVVRSIVI